jgi:4-amino-4-deoxy-L-arabinose transferase-like glycosyltransferase
MKKALDWLTATSERRICLALFGLCAMIYIPLAGNYGMWDPWETHYGEVARQMLERNDFVSLWWPGSPQDRAEFWSKPVLTFWLMAISMKAFGLEWAHARVSEVADSWREEWASRLPFVILGIIAVWAVWEITRRLVGKRAGALAALVLATSSQWALITRQAMTDMPFVVPMTVALALAGLAILLPKEESEKVLPRRQWKFLNWPDAPSFYVFLVMFVLCTLPQMIVISVQVKWGFRIGAYTLRTIGLVPMLLYIIPTLAVLWAVMRAPVANAPEAPKWEPPTVGLIGYSIRWAWRQIVYGARYRRVSTVRELYMLIAWTLCGLATLAKGPAGVALPSIVLLVYLIGAGRWKEIVTKMELPLGLVIFAVTCFPWYHAMLIRHSWGFWNEFIGDNYVHRAGGRHGDRGTFEYYLEYIFYGMFPWSGIVALGALWPFRWLRTDDKRKGLVGFALVWLAVELTIMSLVNTKFHHYILPALPALAILAGLFLDELLTAPSRLMGLAMLLVAAPLTYLSGRDLAAFPPRILWMFNYDYVNMPGTGRPWPTVAVWGDRYEYGTQLLVFAVVATVGVAVLALWALRARGESEAAATTPADQLNRGPYRDAPEVQKPEGEWLSGSKLLMLIGGLVVALVLGILSGPAAPNGTAPSIPRWSWLVPAALMLPFAFLFASSVGRGWAKKLGSATVWIFGAFAVVWTAFLVDKLLIELSPHWSQKHVIASYYQKRSGPDEPLIAWQLYWRGENFYTRNEIYRSSNPNERTIFLGDHNAEKMQQYFTAHAGHRVFFVVERTRYEALRQLLPQAARSTLTIVDDSNCKLYLAVASI